MIREIKLRSYYCTRVRRVVTLVESTRWSPECGTVRHILSCSEQETCCQPGLRDAEPVYPWAECPAFQEEMEDQ